MKNWTLRILSSFCYIFSFIIALFWSTQSWCYNRSESGSEAAHALSIGAGISSPSNNSALVENPAGLSYNEDTQFLGEAGWTNSNLNPLGLGGFILLGNGHVGGGLGFQTFSRQGDNAGNVTLFNFGIATEIDSLNLSFGVTGNYVVSQNGATAGLGNSSSLNGDIGILYNPRGNVRLGFAAFQVFSGVNALGAGIAAQASDWATFALDGSMSPQGTGKIIKPGMGIYLSSFQLTIGYGYNLDNTGNDWIRQGWAYGLGIRLSQNVHLQAYYNQLALYYAGLIIRI
jgi:hypothetical protein